MTAIDDGAVSAEHADIFRAEDPEQDLATKVGEVMAGLPFAAHAIVDLGAGTGIGTIRVADAFPDNAIFAVERSRAMRSILMSRLSSRPDLRERVTVLSGDIFEVDLPGQWGGAIAVHLVCQLPPAQRQQFWALLADRLADNSVAVIDQHFGLDKPVMVERRLSAEVIVGENTYQRWFEAKPTSEDRSRVRNTYRTMRAGHLVAESVSESTAWVAQIPVVLAEIAAAGLSATPVAEHFYALARPDVETS